MLKLLHPESSEMEDGGGKLSSTPLTISNQSLSDQQLPCIFLRWNLGLPRKLFLIELSLDLQWTAEGEPGGVGWRTEPQSAMSQRAPPPRSARAQHKIKKVIQL